MFYWVLSIFVYRPSYVFTKLISFLSSLSLSPSLWQSSNITKTQVLPSEKLILRLGPLLFVAPATCATGLITTGTACAQDPGDLRGRQGEGPSKAQEPHREAVRSCPPKDIGKTSPSFLKDIFRNMHGCLKKNFLGWEKWTKYDKGRWYDDRI